MPSQAVPDNASDYSLTRDCAHRPPGKRPEKARPAYEQLNRLKEKRVVTESQREIASDIAAQASQSSLTTRAHSSWPVFEAPVMTDDPTENARRKSHADCKYYCAVIAYRTGKDIYAKYQGDTTNQYSERQLREWAFPNGPINTSNPPTPLDLCKAIPSSLQQLQQATRTKRRNKRKGGAASQLTGASQGIGASQPDGTSPVHNQSAAGRGSQASGVPVIRNDSGTNMYPGITKGTATPTTVRSRFVAQDPTPSAGASRGQGGSQAVTRARELGYSDLGPSDSQTCRSESWSSGFRFDWKGSKGGPAKQKRKQKAAVDPPPATSTSACVLGSQPQHPSPLGAILPATNTTTSQLNMSHRPETLTSRARAAPKAAPQYTRSPAPAARPSTTQARHTSKPYPQAANVVSASNSIDSNVSGVGGNVTDSANVSVTTSASVPAVTPSGTEHRGQGRQQLRRPVGLSREEIEARRANAPPIVFPQRSDEDDESLYYDSTGDERDLFDDDMHDEVGVAQPPQLPIPEPALNRNGKAVEVPDVTIENVYDSFTKRMIKRIIINPDILPKNKGGNISLISYPVASHEIIKEFIRIARPVFIYLGTYEFHGDDRSDQPWTFTELEINAWGDAERKLGVECEWHPLYATLLWRQLRAYRRRTFDTLLDVACTPCIGFIKNPTNDAQRKANIEKYKRAKNFGFIYKDPLAAIPTEPWNSDFILESVLRTAYSKKTSIGYMETDLFNLVPERYLAMLATLAFRVVCLFKQGSYRNDTELNEARETATFGFAMELIERMCLRKSGDFLEVKKKIQEAANKHRQAKLGLEGTSFDREWQPDGEMQRNGRYMNPWDDTRREVTPVIDGDEIIDDPVLNYNMDAPEFLMDTSFNGMLGRYPAGDYGSDGVLRQDDEEGAYQVPSPLPIQDIPVGEPDAEMMEPADSGEGGATIF